MGSWWVEEEARGDRGSYGALDSDGRNPTRTSPQPRTIVSRPAAVSAAPLRFRAVPWYDRSVERVIEIAPEHTLGDLHRTLVEELGLDDDHLWAFYLSGEWFDRASEFGGAPLEVGPADAAEVGTLGLAPGDTVAYVCDLGDEQRVDLALLGFGDVADAPTRPRVLERVGLAAGRESEPVEPSGSQAPEDRVPTLTQAAAAELDAAVAAWRPDASPGAPRIDLDPVRVGAALEAVLDACPTPRDVSVLGFARELRLHAWMSDAIRTVAARGDPDTALRAAHRFAEMVRMPQVLLQVASALADAGRAPQARQALEAAEAFDAPFGQSARLAAAEVRAALGDAAGVEADLRRLMACRWPSPRIRPLAVEALARLLDDTDRGPEADAIRLAERRRLERDAGVVRRSEPRVGRNDPCPCGSGKKAKRCCGVDPAPRPA